LFEQRQREKEEQEKRGKEELQDEGDEKGDEKSTATASHVPAAETTSSAGAVVASASRADGSGSESATTGHMASITCMLPNAISCDEESGMADRMVRSVGEFKRTYSMTKAQQEAMIQKGKALYVSMFRRMCS